MEFKSSIKWKHKLYLNLPLELQITRMQLTQFLLIVLMLTMLTGGNLCSSPIKAMFPTPTFLLASPSPCLPRSSFLPDWSFQRLDNFVNLFFLKKLLLAQMIVLTMSLLKNLCIFILSYLFLSHLILHSFNKLLKLAFWFISFQLGYLNKCLKYFITAYLGISIFTFLFGISIILLYVSQGCLLQIFSSVVCNLV